MEPHANLQLHFDVKSRKALLSCDGKDYVLPDVYHNREVAEAAAQKFAWEKLGLKGRGGNLRKPSDLPVWLP